jgi:YesN/AraC family two-component response regulator
VNEIQPKFDYAKVGTDVAEELRKHEVAIRVIQAKAIYEMGTELHAAHETLAKRGYGNFYGWCQTCFGMSSSTVDNYVHAYKLIAQNLGKREMLEELPKSLLYAASTESAPPELTQKVLDGEITTHKQWQEEKKALQDRAEQAEARAEQAEQENAVLTEQYNAQAQELQDLKGRPATVVEVMPDDYNEIKTNYNNLQSKCRNLQSANESYAKANEELHRKLAKEQANKSGMSLQEMAEENEAFSEYIKSKHEEAEDAKKFYEAIRNLSKLPNELPEIKELCRCYIAHEATEANRAFTMKSMAQEVRLNIRKLEAALEVFEQRRLGVVK